MKNFMLGRYGLFSTRLFYEKYVNKTHETEFEQKLRNIGRLSF